MKYKQLILDFDGVFTDGSFYYTLNGKAMKKFGPDDADAIKYLNKFIPITIITADKKGYKVSSKRLEEIGFELELVEKNRLDWIKKKFNLGEIIYIADSFTDYYIFKQLPYTICFQNSDEQLKKIANFVTFKKSGERGLAEASDHILKKFYDNTIYNYKK